MCDWKLTQRPTSIPPGVGRRNLQHSQVQSTCPENTTYHTPGMNLYGTVRRYSSQVAPYFLRHFASSRPALCVIMAKKKPAYMYGMTEVNPQAMPQRSAMAVPAV